MHWKHPPEFFKSATSTPNASLATLIYFHHSCPTLFQLALLTFIGLTIFPGESQKCDFPDFAG